MLGEAKILEQIEDTISNIDFSRRGNFTKSILLLLGLGSMHMTINFIPALVQAFIPHTRSTLRVKDVRQALQSLETRKLIKTNKSGRYILTTEGKLEIKKFRLELYSPKKNIPKKWDGKWRMIIFDIPEEQAQKRKILRSRLHTIGFVQRQKSVWVYPYSCYDLVELIRNTLDLGDEVLYAVVDHLEHDALIKNSFKLN